jgi:Spy/CpxP family protein refolding chaperone
MFRKIFIGSALFAALTLPIFAQRSGGLRGQLGQGRGIDRIQQALNLTADQVNSLKALTESQRQALQPLVKEAREKAQALRDLQQQPNPNPTDIGNAMLAMRATRERMKAAQQNFRQSLNNLLTTEQREKLDQMKTRTKRFGRRNI